MRFKGRVELCLLSKGINATRCLQSGMECLTRHILMTLGFQHEVPSLSMERSDVSLHISNEQTYTGTYIRCDNAKNGVQCVSKGVMYPLHTDIITVHRQRRYASFVLSHRYELAAILMTNKSLVVRVMYSQWFQGQDTLCKTKYLEVNLSGAIICLDS